MGSLSSLYIKKDVLETLLKGVNAKGNNGIEITVSISDESKSFNGDKGTTYQNASAFVSQSKEDRDSGKAKYYVGNGKCFWTDGSIVVAGDSQSSTTKTSKKAAAAEVDDDLPF